MTSLSEIYKEQRILVLPKQSKLTEELIRQFDNLLDFATPGQLRSDLTEIYHQYIIKEHGMLPIDFEKTAMNMHYLIDFFKRVETELKLKE